ncbi:ABC transporter ATP-binding protein [Paralcaligenes sp. KSB-10]|jgi:branched-chain amino acid transport system ATP-binding protein|uniref:ABC transporter ATP-binding protein n=1 Tax=Paralcaligenes sp. KSB-10 TaxID=2901142 RepID=UPI001E2EDA71|nr:ABC transporter ATP-binding protein [Paralcaligenes sp. KSB-10]UHL63623.1 ABC transporter ATP-binding protein [Paralcaligenes sp. KSB-10]
MTQPILEARNIVKRYGKFVALAGVDLCVQAKTIHSVIGPNGAGKTTLFHSLTGTVPLTEGSIIFDGHDVSQRADYQRVQAGMARSFQVTSLFPTLSVHENLRLATQGIRPLQALRLWSLIKMRREQADMIEAILEKVGLTQVRHKLSSALSHGQQRRLEVGMALAARPRAIFLDEPTSGMGIDDIDSMKKLIYSLRDELTVILIEHNMGIVMDISDTITVMQQGKVLVEGEPQAIKSDDRVRSAYLGNMITGGR